MGKGMHTMHGGSQEAYIYVPWGGGRIFLPFWCARTKWNGNNFLFTLDMS